MHAKFSASFSKGSRFQDDNHMNHYHEPFSKILILMDLDISKDLGLISCQRFHAIFCALVSKSIISRFKDNGMKHFHEPF